MATKEAKARATAKYEAKAYDKVLIRMKAGQKEIIQAHADEMSESLNGFITRAIAEAIWRDKVKTVVRDDTGISFQSSNTNEPKSKVCNEFDPTLLKWQL